MSRLLQRRRGHDTETDEESISLDIGTDAEEEFTDDYDDYDDSEEEDSEEDYSDDSDISDESESEEEEQDENTEEEGDTNEEEKEKVQEEKSQSPEKEKDTGLKQEEEEKVHDSSHDVSPVVTEINYQDLQLQEKEKRINEHREYRRKLAEDPSFVPYVGLFWSHDDRYREDSLTETRESEPHFSSTSASIKRSYDRNLDPLMYKKWDHSGYEELLRMDEEDERREREARENGGPPVDERPPRQRYNNNYSYGRGRGRGRGGYQHHQQSNHHNQRRPREEWPELTTGDNGSTKAQSISGEKLDKTSVDAWGSINRAEEVQPMVKEEASTAADAVASNGWGEPIVNTSWDKVDEPTTTANSIAQDGWGKPPSEKQVSTDGWGDVPVSKAASDNGWADISSVNKKPSMSTTDKSTTVTTEKKAMASDGWEAAVSTGLSDNWSAPTVNTDTNGWGNASTALSHDGWGTPKSTSDPTENAPKREWNNKPNNQQRRTGFDSHGKKEEKARSSKHGDGEIPVTERASSSWANVKPDVEISTTPSSWVNRNSKKPFHKSNDRHTSPRRGHSEHQHEEGWKSNDRADKPDQVSTTPTEQQGWSQTSTTTEVLEAESSSVSANAVETTAISSLDNSDNGWGAPPAKKETSEGWGSAPTATPEEVIGWSSDPKAHVSEKSNIGWDSTPVTKESSAGWDSTPAAATTKESNTSQDSVAPVSVPEESTDGWGVPDKVESWQEKPVREDAPSSWYTSKPSDKPKPANNWNESTGFDQSSSSLSANDGWATNRSNNSNNWNSDREWNNKQQQQQRMQQQQQQQQQQMQQIQHMQQMQQMQLPKKTRGYLSQKTEVIESPPIEKSAWGTFQGAGDEDSDVEIILEAEEEPEWLEEEQVLGMTAPGEVDEPSQPSPPSFTKGYRPSYDSGHSSPRPEYTRRANNSRKPRRNYDMNWRQREEPEEFQPPMYYPAPQMNGNVAYVPMIPNANGNPMYAMPFPMGPQGGNPIPSSQGENSNPSPHLAHKFYPPPTNVQLPPGFEANGMVYYGMDPSAMYAQPFYYYAPMANGNAMYSNEDHHNKSRRPSFPSQHMNREEEEDGNDDEGWGPTPDAVETEEQWASSTKDFQQRKQPADYNHSSPYYFYPQQAPY